MHLKIILNPLNEPQTPQQYFKTLFTEDLFNNIVHNTNLYSVQNSRAHANPKR